MPLGNDVSWSVNTFDRVEISILELVYCAPKLKYNCSSSERLTCYIILLMSQAQPLLHRISSLFSCIPCACPLLLFRYCSILSQTHLVLSLCVVIYMVIFRSAFSGSSSIAWTPPTYILLTSGFQNHKHSYKHNAKLLNYWVAWQTIKSTFVLQKQWI